MTVSKVKWFLNSRTFYTEKFFRHPKFQRNERFFQAHKCNSVHGSCFFRKTGKNKNVVKFLLVRRLVWLTSWCKGNENERFEHDCESVFKNDYRKNRPKNFWTDNGSVFAAEFEKLYNARGIQVNCTRSETKAAPAEPKKLSVQNILYRYMEDYGYQYIPKLPQLVTTFSSRENWLTDLKPNDVKSSDFLSILYSKPVWEYRKPNIRIGDWVGISKYKLPFRKGYES